MRLLVEVQRRLNVQKYFQTLSKFLFYGFLACVPLVLIDSLTSFNIPPLALLGVTLGIAAIALIASLLRPVSLYEAARTIDMGASLKDRVVSGLEQIEAAEKDAEPNEDAELKEILKEIEERALELKKPKIAPKEALAVKSSACLPTCVVSATSKFSSEE